MQLTKHDHPNPPPGLRVVTVPDSRIDAAVAIQFKDQMRAVTEGGPKRVLLDLEGVTFIDSSGLGAIVAAMKLLRGAKPIEVGEGALETSGGHELELAGLTPVVEKVFKLTRMDTVFTIHPNVEAALGRMAS